MSFEEELVEKRADLLEKGVDPYPYKFERSHTLAQLRAQQEELMDKKVQVAGRLVAYRGKGKMVFADLADFDGRLQVMFPTLSASSAAAGERCGD